MKTITFDSWMDTFNPPLGRGQDCGSVDGVGIGFGSYFSARQMAQRLGLLDGEPHIWTIHHNDEDDCWLISPGPECVNVIGYVVTRKPCGDLMVIW